MYACASATQSRQSQNKQRHNLICTENILHINIQNASIFMWKLDKELRWQPRGRGSPNFFFLLRFRSCSLSQLNTKLNQSVSNNTNYNILGDPDEQNHHNEHAGHHEDEQPLEACRLGSQRVYLCCSRGCTPSARQAMLDSSLGGIKDLPKQLPMSTYHSCRKKRWRKEAYYLLCFLNRLVHGETALFQLAR